MLENTRKWLCSHIKFENRLLAKVHYTLQSSGSINKRYHLFRTLWEFSFPLTVPSVVRRISHARARGMSQASLYHREGSITPSPGFHFSSIRWGTQRSASKYRGHLDILFLTPYLFNNCLYLCHRCTVQTYNLLLRTMTHQYGLFCRVLYVLFRAAQHCFLGTLPLVHTGL